MAYKDREKALAYWKAYNAARRPKKAMGERQKAIKNNEPHYFTGRPCVRGHVSARNTSTRKCMECDREDKKRLNIEHPEKHAAKQKAQYRKHRDYILAQKKLYRQANKGKILALNAARKQRVVERTPKWLDPIDKAEIEFTYTWCTALRSCGLDYHVDHIVPLQGKTVSGLHVPWNLQVIPAVDNIRKKNRWDHV